MFCPNCGKEMNDGAVFCSNCGWSKRKNVRLKPYFFVFIFIPVLIGIVMLLGKNGINNLSYKKKIINQIESLDDIVVAAHKYWAGNRLKWECNGDLIERKNSEEEDKEYTVTIGNYKGDPIKWIKLYKEDGKIYLISKYVLDVVPYKLTSIKRFRTVNNVGWIVSSLRAFANNEFYNNAFSEEEKGLLCEMRSSFTNQNGKEGQRTAPDNVLVLRDDMYEKIIKRADEYHHSLSAKSPAITTTRMIDEYRLSGIDVLKAWATYQARSTGLTRGPTYKRITYDAEKDEFVEKSGNTYYGPSEYYMCGGQFIKWWDEFVVSYVDSTGIRRLENGLEEWGQWPKMTIDIDDNHLSHRSAHWKGFEVEPKYQDVLSGFRPVICIDLNE